MGSITNYHGLLEEIESRLEQSVAEERLFTVDLRLA